MKLRFKAVAVCLAAVMALGLLSPGTVYAQADQQTEAAQAEPGQVEVITGQTGEETPAAEAQEEETPAEEIPTEESPAQEQEEPAAIDLPEADPADEQTDSQDDSSLPAEEEATVEIAEADPAGEPESDEVTAEDPLTQWVQEHPDQLSALYAGDETAIAALAEYLGEEDTESLSARLADLKTQNDTLVKALEDGTDVQKIISENTSEDAAEQLSVETMAIDLFRIKLDYLSGLLNTEQEEANTNGTLSSWTKEMKTVLGSKTSLASKAAAYGVESAVLSAVLQSMGIEPLPSLTLTNVELETPAGVNDYFTYTIYVWFPGTATPIESGNYGDVPISSKSLYYVTAANMGLPYNDYYNQFGIGTTTLAAGESVTIEGLPEGCTYRVLAAASANYYVRNLTSTCGTVDEQLGTVLVEGASGHNDVVCYNDYAPHSLLIGEKVMSSDPESVDDEFTFDIYLYSHGSSENTPLLSEDQLNVAISTVGTEGAEAPELGDTLTFTTETESHTLPGLSVPGTYNVATVKLKHGQSIVLKNLGSNYGCYVYQRPETHYMLYELRSRHVYVYNAADYTGSYDNHCQYIDSCGVSSSVGFINAQVTLSITKEVENSDTTRDFVFNVYFLQYLPDTGTREPMAAGEFPLTYTNPTGDEPATMEVRQGEEGTMKTTFRFDDGSQYTVSWASAQVKVKAGQTVTIGKLPAGIAYYISEVPVTNYTITKITSTAADATVNSSYLYNLLCVDDEAATFTNTYVQPEGRDLTISKTVTGNMGDPNQNFTFRVALTDAAGSPLGEYDIRVLLPDGTETMYTTDADGILEVSLKHGQTVTLEDLPDGTRYTITETDAAGYTTSFDVTGGTYDTSEGQTLSGTLNTDTDVVVQTTNDCTVAIPTGVRMDIQPLVLITAFSAGALLLMAVSKRKNQKRR